MMKLAQIFSGGAVFQAEKPIRIFGTGDGIAEATFDGERQKTAAQGGKWSLSFAPRSYGGPYELSLTLDGETTVYKDIYVGEVLLLAGQSNIAMKLKHTSYPAEEYENEPRLRIFCGGLYDGENFFSPDDGWISCSRDSAPEFSAIGYHIGLELCKARGIAVGLIACYLGSSVIESWISAEIGGREEFYLPREEKYDSPYVRGEHNKYGRLYEIKQQPIAPYSVGNVIWYQGESNTGKSEWKNYTALLAELINCWRRDFCDSELPFTVVQIADWDERDDDAWHGIQCAQEKITETVDNVTVVKSSDLCETNDIHPPTKIRLAKRIFERLN